MLSDESSAALTRAAFSRDWGGQDLPTRSADELIARELDGIRTELRSMRMRGLTVHVTQP